MTPLKVILFREGAHLDSHLLTLFRFKESYRSLVSYRVPSTSESVQRTKLTDLISPLSFVSSVTLSISLAFALENSRNS